MGFSKLVRIETGGAAHYGDLISSEGGEYLVQKLSGSISSGFEADGSEPVRVKKLLCPLEKTPIIICVGLNYQKHAEEANLPVPTHPVIFTKPADSLAGADAPVSIHPSCQSMLDYEGELTFVVSQNVKNLPVSGDFSLDDYVLGYTAGNDVSARNFQLPTAGGGQYCYAKSFDGFAPIGPFIASPQLVPNPQTLKYVTRVNGVVKQETSTDDMIWSVKEILRHLSQGTTVRAGTVVMTGTPSGVGYFRKEFLQDGDVVEVEIEGLVKLVNTMKFE